MSVVLVGTGDAVVALRFGKGRFPLLPSRLFQTCFPLWLTNQFEADLHYRTLSTSSVMRVGSPLRLMPNEIVTNAASDGVVY